MNKEGKKEKDKKKKKVMMATWSDSDPSSFESELKMDIKANFCLMAIDDDEVCIDDLDILIDYKTNLNASLMILKNLGIDVKTTRKSLSL